MNIAVLGATGRTGVLLVHELLTRGHHVTVLARDPDKLGGGAERVTIVTGDSRDRAALGRLVGDASAVVSALGPSAREASLHTETARALVDAMHAGGVRRFVGVSGAGIDVPGDQKTASARIISTIIQRVGGAVVRDKSAEYDVFDGSDLDWTLVRPPRLQDGAATGRIEHDGHRSTRSTRITRGDLAAFLVDALEQDLYVRGAPFVATAR